MEWGDTKEKRHIIDTLLHNKVALTWASNIPFRVMFFMRFPCWIDGVCATGGSTLQYRVVKRWLKATLGQFYLNLYCICAAVRYFKWKIAINLYKTSAFMMKKGEFFWIIFFFIENAWHLISSSSSRLWMLISSGHSTNDEWFSFTLSFEWNKLKMLCQRVKNEYFRAYGLVKINFEFAIKMRATKSENLYFSNQSHHFHLDFVWIRHQIIKSNKHFILGSFWNMFISPEHKHLFITIVHIEYIYHECITNK